jgi:predicted ribosomally synthesized peptide with SipW-like signal peptide
MKQRIAFSLMVLALASTLVGGATLALFTDQVEADPVAFTTGTVEITGGDISGDVSVISVGTSGDMGIMCWPSPSDDPAQKTVTWCVENTGSKAAYIRVRARGGNEDVQGESAAGEGEEKYGPAWSRMWNTYDLSSGEEMEIRLVAGQHYDHVGWVTVYKDYWNLYVRHETIDGWTLTDTKVYAETNDDFPTGFGDFRFPHPGLDNVTSDLHVIPYDQLFEPEGYSDTIYLVTHADVEKLPAEWTINSACSTSWIAGTAEGDNWWYYETPVPAGETVCISLDVLYYDSKAEYYLEAEAVQASHQAIDYIDHWNGHPL